MYVSSSQLTNVSFSGNSASSSGGGMYWTRDLSVRQTLANVTFSGNRAGKNGGGIYNAGSSPTVRNTVLWGNTPDQIANGFTVTAPG